MFSGDYFHRYASEPGPVEGGVHHFGERQKAYRRGTAVKLDGAEWAGLAFELPLSGFLPALLSGRPDVIVSVTPPLQGAAVAMKRKLGQHRSQQG